MKHHHDETVTETDAKPDALGFFEGIHLAGHTGKWLRVSYAVQKKHFGRALFGKKAVRVNDNGVVDLWHSVAFGMDWEHVRMMFDQLTGQFVSASTGERVGV